MTWSMRTTSHLPTTGSYKEEFAVKANDERAIVMLVILDTQNTQEFLKQIFLSLGKKKPNIRFSATADFESVLGPIRVSFDQEREISP